MLCAQLEPGMSGRGSQLRQRASTTVFDIAASLISTSSLGVLSNAILDLQRLVTSCGRPSSNRRRLQIACAILPTTYYIELRNYQRSHM